MQVTLPGQGRTLALALIVGLGLVPSQPLMAQAFKTTVLAPAPAPVPVEGEAQNAETVLLLSALAKIESDLLLGMLFLADGLVNPDGSHFTHPRIETYPLIKDGLAAAGVADFEGLLQKVEGGGDQATVTAAYTEVVAALTQARSKLNPSTRDMVLSIVEEVRADLGEFNPTGPTEVNDFQDGWAMLVVARGHVDLLTRSDDPVVAKAALEMGQALDDVILSMPDPAVTAPVDFDPAPIAALLARLEALAGSV